jgi:CRISPR/Cas system CMR subunit Cmr4 (Cas7 group RAMP superfamily)
MRLIIEFSSALHHGTGFGLAGLVDRALLRDQWNMPYLSGAALKGKFRHATLRLLRSTGQTCCGPARARCRPGHFCPLCQVFGSALVPGAAVFSDAYPIALDRQFLRAQIEAAVSPVLPGGSDVRASTAISRHSRTVLPQHLFTTEVLPRGLTFEADVGGPLTEAQQLLLCECAKFLTYFGAGSARGLGACQYSIERGA